MRTRMYGGVGGEEPRGFPLSRYLTAWDGRIAVNPGGLGAEPPVGETVFRLLSFVLRLSLFGVFHAITGDVEFKDHAVVD